MKKFIALLLISVMFVSCKNDKKIEESESVELTSDVVEIAGSFMYFEDAAVFNTNTELYGLIENDMLEDLILRSETLKNEPSDEVDVILKVKKSKKPANEEGWENRIEIVEIVKVTKSDPSENTIIKLGTKTNAENQ